MTPTAGRLAYVERATLLALVVGLALLLVHTQWLWRLDHVIYDTQLRFWQRPAASDIVIIAIDEETLRSIGRWPWSRGIHADLLARLEKEQPRAITFDIIFAEPDAQDPSADARFVAATQRSGRVALPLLMEQPRRDGQPIETLPFPALSEVAAAMGHVHVELDPDGIARRLYLYEGLGEPHWPHLSLAMMQIGAEALTVEVPGAATDPAPYSPLVWVRSASLLIPFAGPPGHFPHISYSQVLKGDFSPGTFRDKYVLIGTTAVGLGDALPTPFSGFSHSMSGVEINANILDALRRGLVISPLEKSWQMLFTGLTALTPLLLFPRLAPRANLLLTGALLVLTLGASTALLILAHLWFPPTPALVAIILSYPLWSWRRLELAMRFLGEELDDLQQQQASRSPARQISTAESLAFITKLLPVSGWQLQDSDGTVLAGEGTSPGPAPAGITDGEQQEHGDDLWTHLAHAGKPLILGVRWSPETLPKPEEKALLLRFVRQFRGSDTESAAYAAKDVQSRIAQVQQATGRIRELQQFIDDSLANMADGVIVADDRGQVLLANARAAWYLCGDDHRELAGQPLMTLLDAIDLEAGARWPALLRNVILRRERALAGGRHQSGRDLLVQVAALDTASSHLSGLVFNFSDISLLKGSERKRNEMLNFLSHDLRAPLVSMTALLELAKTHKPGDELAGLLQRMQGYTGKTLNLAEQFLQLARAESSEGFVFGDVDMVSVALNAIEQVWGQASRAGVHLQQTIAVEEAWISGDGSLLERALVNLLDNAIKYSERGTTVTLNLSMQDNSICCCISDQGSGIPDGELPRLFDRFHRVKRAGSDRRSGAGLGLALVDVVARRHGGHVTVDSKLNQGSRFCLVIPRQKKAG